MKYLKLYESFKGLPGQRISCAGLASIMIDGKYLLVQNKSSRKRGQIIYGPAGGALEYDETALSFLKNLDAVFERDTPDLRLKIPLENVDAFTEWFKSGGNRESSVVREFIEEMVDEEHVLDSLDESQVKETYIDTIQESKERLGMLSIRFFEIFKLELSPEIEDELRIVAADPDSTIQLFTEEEIRVDTTEKVIGNHSVHIL